MTLPELPIFYAPDEGGASGAGGTGEGGANGGASGTGGGGSDAGGGEAFHAITSQEQFDRVVGTLLTKERGKYADYEDLKTKASKFDELDAASKSELEKEREARAASDKKAEDAVARANAVAAKADVFAAAVTMSIVDPEAAYALIRESITFDEVGNPTNVTELLTKLTDAKPYLVGKSPSQHGTGGGGARQDQAGASSGGGWIRDGFKN